MNSNIKKTAMQILIHYAMERQTLTYRDLAERINEFSGERLVHTTGSQLGKDLGPILDSINLYCKSKNQPPISVLVVRSSGADKDMPGKGFWEWISQNLSFFVAPDQCSRKMQAAYLCQSVYDFWNLDV